MTAEIVKLKASNAERILKQYLALAEKGEIAELYIFAPKAGTSENLFSATDGMRLSDILLAACILRDLENRLVNA